MPNLLSSLGSRQAAPPMWIRLFGVALLLLAAGGAAILLLTRSPATAIEGSGVYKIRVEQDGIARLALNQLPGLDAAHFDTEHLALTSNDQAVPFEVLDEAGNPALYFYGLAKPDQYADYNTYWLHLREPDKGIASAATPHATLSVRTVLAPDGSPAETTVAAARAEQDLIYVPKGPQPDEHWLWQQMLAPAAMTATVTIQNMVDLSATVHISVWASTQAPQDPDHHVIVHINNKLVGDESWDGSGEKVLSLAIERGVLSDGQNDVRISVPGDTGAAVESMALDWVQIDYEQRLRAQGDEAAWTSDGTSRRFQIPGFDQSPLMVWDITDPLEPALLNGFQIEHSADGYTLDFNDTSDSPRRYLAVTPDKTVAPAAVTPWDGTNLRAQSQGGDYIVISHPDFVAALQPLVEQRQADGLRVVVVTTDEVYDSFSNGRPDPHGIRDFLRYAYQNWPAPAPKFVLLVGDASYDYRDRLKGKYKDWLPTYLLDTTYVGETASDNWFVRFGSDAEDYRPSMAIGRLPAQSLEQTTVMVDKILKYETAAPAGDWRHRALLVADNDDKVFEQMSDTLATDYLTKTYSIDKVYIGQASDPNAAVLQAFDAGVSFVNYVGHGSLDVWGAEKALQTADVARLSNAQGRLPVLVTMTCLTGFFHHPNAESLGEVLLRAPDKGIVAAVVPTSESVTSQQQPLANAFYQQLFRGASPTIGEALMRAKQAMPDDGKQYRDVMETFNLLGDPATRLVAPEGTAAN